MIQQEHYRASEIAVCACLVKANGYTLAECLKRVKDTDFNDPFMQIAFRAVTSLIGRRVTVDVANLRQSIAVAITDHPVFGGLASADKAQEIVIEIFAHRGATGSLADSIYHADRVADAARCREIYQSVIDLKVIVEEHDVSHDNGFGGAELAARILQRANKLSSCAARSGEETRLSLLLEPHKQKFWEDYAKDKGVIAGLRTGFPTLDREIDGMIGGDLILIAADTGVGKTALALDIIRKSARLSRAAWQVFSYEMGTGKLINRLVFAEAQIDRSAYKNKDLSKEQEEGLNRAFERLSKLPEQHLHYDTTLTVADIAAICRRAKYDNECSGIMVDYLQLVPSSNERSGKSSDTRSGEVNTIARGLKNLAGELNVPVIALTQLNDDGKVYESRAIKHHTDIMLLLKEGDPIESDTQKKAYLLIKEKVRDGERGSIPLYFWGAQTRFQERITNHAEIDADLYEAGF